MTDLRTAAQQALEAMEKATRFMSDADYLKLNEAIENLRAALAEPQISFEEAMRLKDQMPKGLFRNVDGQTADTIWLCAIEVCEMHHGIRKEAYE